MYQTVPCDPVLKLGTGVNLATGHPKQIAMTQPPSFSPGFSSTRTPGTASFPWSLTDTSKFMVASGATS